MIPFVAFVSVQVMCPHCRSIVSFASARADGATAPRDLDVAFDTAVGVLEAEDRDRLGAAHKCTALPKPKLELVPGGRS